MGLIDRMNEARKRAEQQAHAQAQANQKRDILAKNSAESAAENAEQRRARLESVGIAHYVQDSEAIAELLKVLPRHDYDDYFRQVSRFTGFSVEIGVYTCPRPNLKPDHPLRDIVDDITAFRDIAFKEARLTPLRSSPEEDIYLPPTNIFLGRNTPIELSFGRRLQELPLPGIGISLVYGSSEKQETHRVVNGQKQGGTLTTQSSSSVFVRLSGIVYASVTNAKRQDEFLFSDFKLLDDSLERALKHPVRTKPEYFFEPHPPTPRDFA